MQLHSPSLFVTAVALAACASTPPPTPDAHVDVTPPAAPVEAKFRGHLTVDLVPLADHGIGSEGTAIASEALKRMPDMLGCMRSMPPKATDVWLVGRVGEDGRLGAMTASLDVPAPLAACAAKALAGIHVPSVDPIALSVVLHAEPAPTDCKGDECTVLPVPTGLVTNDEAGEGPAPPSGTPEGVSTVIHGDEALADVFGMGGLGLVGTGDGGQRGEGIGLGSLGTIGHGSGLGTGQGFGNGHGRLAGSHGKPPPKVRMGATSVSGRLPPEVIQRIVRQNFGRFRLCYENGLRTTPTLAGMVTVSFVIGKDGKVSTVADDKSDLPDAAVVACVVRSFSGLEFPQPEGGIVKVTYPIRFDPGSDPPVLKVGGVGFPGLDAAKVAAKLGEQGWRAATVPGPTPTDAFAVFAIKQGASTNPMERPQGFLTAVRRAPSSGAAPPFSNESEGFRLIATGDAPMDLLKDLVDAEAAKAP